MGTQYRNKKATSPGLQYPVNDGNYQLWNDHHDIMLTSGEIEDFKKLQDFSRDIETVEHKRDETGAVQYIIHRKGYDIQITNLEGRNLDISDILAFEYIMQLAAPLKDKEKEGFKLVVQYNELFGEVKKTSGNAKQKNAFIESLEKLSSCFIASKRVNNTTGEIIEGTTLFNMFTADYSKRGKIEIFINPLYNRYFLQRSSVKSRSKVIQRMDPVHDITAIYIMRAIDNFIGQEDPKEVDMNGNKIWRLKVPTLLNYIYSLKNAKATVFDLTRGLPPAKEFNPEPVKEKDRKRQSDVHKTMIPFIEGMNKCTVDYSGTRGLLSWKFVRPGGLALSIKEREQVTYKGKGTDTSKLDFDTFLDMEIEFIPYDYPDTRPKEERLEKRESIINKKMIRKSKAGKKKKD